MNEQTIMLAGATGLVGGYCLRLLQEADFCKHINVLTRKPVEGIESFSKARQFLVDFDKPETFGPAVMCDTVICALGTTIKKAGSKDAFQKVDFTYCLEVAKAGLTGGASHFLMVTAMGASPRSTVFYNRIKGDVEQAVMGLGYKCVSLFRPSLILGDRKENRMGEEMGKFFSQLFSFAIPAKYKAIHAELIARAMVRQSVDCQNVSRIFESHEIRSLGQAT